MAVIRKNVQGSGYGNIYTDSLIWGGSAWDVSSGSIKVWFGQAEDYYEALEVHGDSPTVDENSSFYDWTEAEYAAFSAIAGLYESVCGLRFEAATSAGAADMVWWKTDLGSDIAGRHEAPTYDQGNSQLWGFFNPNSPSWANLAFGSDGWHTIIHELGHGLGLAHPHDGGDYPGASTFPGVDPNDSYSMGDHGLNQGVWTIMSYNTGWAGAPGDATYGAQGGLGAFDIAALQALYGVNTSTATGNDTYELPTSSPYLGQEGWSCIWDAGGWDTISAASTGSSVTIDLRAATLRSGDPDAGGFISNENGAAGGYTIAHGVIIESAVGGRGADELIGNWANNVLSGSAGNDVLWGDAGNDVLRGGQGRDFFAFDTRPHKSSNRDQIADYSVASDTIWLDNQAFTKLGRGSFYSPVKLKNDMFVTGSRAKDREDRIIYDSKKGVLSYDADGTGSKYKPVEFATLKKGLKMTYNDFFVI
jgi:serralysin